MLILIAESKTMGDAQREVSPAAQIACRPLLDDRAELLMSSWRELTQEQIAARLGLSGTRVRRIQQEIYDFPNKSTGYPAIEAYTGVVFRQLDAAHLPEPDREYCDGHVRIISSLYGYLRPYDIIKPYRLDFTLKEAPDGSALHSYWRQHVTVALVRELQERGITEIIDLLPGDAAKCVDWKVVKRYARVYKVDFKTPSGPDKMKTPASGRLKELRGRLLRQILRQHPATVREVSDYESADYEPQGELRFPGTLTYFTA